MATSETRESALAALRQSWKNAMASSSDEGARVIDFDAVESIFDLFWEHQFLEDRRSISREIERLVQLRISSALLEEGEGED